MLVDQDYPVETSENGTLFSEQRETYVAYVLAVKYVDQPIKKYKNIVFR